MKNPFVLCAATLSQPRAILVHCAAILSQPRALLVLCAAILSQLPSPTAAEVRLPGWMTSNMVLQQQTTLHLEATARPKARVKVTTGWGHQTTETRADADGRFTIDLAVPTAGGPYTMTFDDGRKTTLTNVMVGEVWFCSGQSNMEMPVEGWGRVNNYEQEVAQANHPLIRLFQVKQVTALTPQADVPLGHTGGWAVCSPDMVREFSATAYFFARTVSEKLGIAVGVVNSSWGGTPAEAWTSHEALRHVTGFEQLIQRIDDTGFDADKVRQLQADIVDSWKPASPERPWWPASCYNAMVAPFLGMPIAGILWYQGCNNVGRAKQYESLFQTLIHDWKARFGDHPFYFVQLANFQERHSVQPMSPWAALRDAQRMALQIDGTGMMVNIDLGEAGDIHPKNKQEVGRRLARLALSRTYRQPEPGCAPEFERMTVYAGKALLTFAMPQGAETLAPDEDVKGFTIAGPDHQWHTAKAHTVGAGAVIVESEEVAVPIAVRYGWADNPECTLQTHEGFHVSPFRTDNW